MAKRILAVFLVFFSLLGFLLSGLSKPVQAYYTNMPASVVIGQPDFTSNTANNGGVSARSLYNPGRPFSDGKRLFVVDAYNHRVLIWNSIPTENNTPADVVLGQPDFISNTENNGSISARTLKYPTYVLSDGTHLFISDSGNSRVLVWNSIPTINQQPADVVIGQPDFVTSSTGLSASKFSGAYGISIYNGKLIIADTNNRRILIYNTIPTTNGISADVVVGQDDFNSNSTGVTANKFGGSPRGLVVVENRLFVSDFSANRILVWDSLPTTNGASADIVLGQPDFVSNTAWNGGVSCASVAGPDGLAIIGNGKRLAVGESYRLLIFNTLPTEINQTADIVLGQPNCSTATPNFGGISSSSLAGTVRSGVEVDNKLIIGDGAVNNRVLIFNNVVSTPKINLSANTEAAGNGRLRMRGNVRLGEWERYSLSRNKLTVSVSGGGEGEVSSLYGLREDAHDNLYEFYHEFDPYSNINPSTSEGYTLKFHTFSSNADESFSFYFTPFEIRSITTGYLPSFTFKVNKDQFSRLSDNLAEYEIQVKKTGSDSWETYLDNIPLSASSTNASLTTTYDQTNGLITVRSKTKSLVSGTYQVKVVAVDDWGHRQETPTLSFTSTGGVTSGVIRPSLSIYSGFFPLQINSISGVKSGVISSFSTSTINPIYYSSTSTPTFKGIAYAGSTVTLNVTNSKTKTTKVYTTKVKQDSTWSLSASLFSSSIIDIWIQEENKYNELPPFQINISIPQNQGVQGEATEEEKPAPEPTPQPSSTPQPEEENKSCFLWWCW